MNSTVARARAFKRYEFKVRAEDLKFKGPEPVWPTTYPPEWDRKGNMSDGLNWYNYVCDAKDRRRFLEDWIHVRRESTRIGDLKTLSRISDKHMTTTYAHLARMDIMGFPVHDQDRELIWKKVVEGYNKSKPDHAIEDVFKNPAASNQETVQDRMNRQVAEVVSDIEDVLFDVLNDKQQLGSSAQVLNKIKLSSQHYKKLAQRLEPLVLEFKELKEKRVKHSKLVDQDTQLLEGYNWISSRNLRAGSSFLEDCLDTCRRLMTERQVERVRKQRPVDKNKLVRKFKYLAESKEPKLTSISPVDCLNVSEVWVYNTRTRKLGVYYSEFPGGITIKGSQFVGIVTHSSTQKTLRKPSEQLAEFLKIPKSQNKKYFDKIKGTETKLKPRSNENTVILKKV
jgi:hypothetical protein